THSMQSMQWSLMTILASYRSMESTGQTATQVPQKSHLSLIAPIISQLGKPLKERGMFDGQLPAVSFPRLKFS
ncbi:hypothetical protein MJD09_28365, partial [bacterium]|nr:hypothetical protein [bacterium]